MPYPGLSAVVDRDGVAKTDSNVCRPLGDA
jgi:hypothetical protein